MKKTLSKLLKKNVKLYTILAYGGILLLGICLAYYFLPILLNYAPNSINTEFDKEFSSRIYLFYAVFIDLHCYFCIRKYLAFS